MTNSNTNIPILDDDAVAEIEARLKDWDGGDQYPASWNNVRALCQTVRALRAENERLATVSGEWAGLLDRIRAWSKCEDSYPLDEHINNITVDRGRLQSQLEQLRAENERCKRALRKFVNWYAADSTEEKRDSAFDAAQEALADERLYTEAEFKVAYPDRAFTWDLDEHPEDGSGDICACRPCRELSYED